MVVRQLIPVEKPHATELVLVGAGLSLDLAHPSEYQPTSDRIVIGLNMVGGLIDCDYLVLTDKLALNNWGHWGKKRPGQYVVAPGGMSRKCGTATRWPDVPWIIAEPVIPGPPFKNARTLGLALTYALHNQLPNLKRIVYIGMDCGTWIGTDNSGAKQGCWQYANCLLKFKLFQKDACRFYTGKPSPKMIFELTHYSSALDYIYELLRSDAGFARKLECRSFFDWNRINLTVPHKGLQRGYNRMKSRNPAIGDFNYHGFYTRVDNVRRWQS